MKKWHLSVYLMLSMSWTSGLVPRFGKLLPGKIVINSVPEFLKQTFEQTQSPVPKPTKLLAALANASSEIGSLEADQVLSGSIELQDAKGAQNLTYDAGPDPSDRFPVQHAGLPQGLAANALPLKDSDHELMFNVSWTSPFGHPARSYSIEISNLTNSENCMHMCYAYDIPGEARWWLVPSFRNPAPETCAIRPGCSYRIWLIAHPWDGHTSANIDVSLDECESGVCSCDHAPRLPMPSVSATTVSVQGEIFANITWSLPPPSEPLRLPPNLNKQYYYVSIGKQMVSSAHPSPWFAHTISRKVNTGGLMAAGDELRWFLLPIVERDGRNDRQTKVVLDVKLLARVSVVDDRGCLGPAGNATAYDPTTTVRSPIRNYVIWAVFGGLCVLAMFAILAVSTRVAKRVLHALRPAPVSDPLDPLRRRPAWLPLPLRSNDGPRGQVEQSPLYVHKDYETDLTDSDEWEVHRSRVQLGALIGTGAFGRVHVAQLDMPGGESMTVAAKMLTENSSEEEIQDFLREIIMLKHVGAHKHVIRLIGCCTRRPPLIALLEHAPRGDLLTLLRKARGRRKENGSNVTRRVDSNVAQPSQEGSQYTNLSDGDPSLSGGKLISELEYQRSNDHYVAEPALHLDGSTMRDYALQVALGMSHLEDRGITHRDLAARNILVDGAGVLKVADFGLSRSGVYVHTRSRPVPLRWLAPEAILHAQYCSASDVWAFAVLLWEIATLGGFPYAELSNHQVPAYLASGNRLPKPERASPRLYQLMTECWSENPVDRPTFAQIIAKLTVQNLLYVDLECVLPPSEDDLSEMSDYFSMSEMKM